MNSMKLKIITGLVLITLLSGCEITDQVNDFDYVKYGTSFGECLGYCINSVTISDALIIYEKKGWDIGGQLPDYQATDTTVYKLWNKLQESVNYSGFIKLDEVIGCPDCADGGAEWIEIKSDGKVHRTTFEYRNEPDEVKGYIDYLRECLGLYE